VSCEIVVIDVFAGASCDVKVVFPTIMTDSFAGEVVFVPISCACTTDDGSTGSAIENNIAVNAIPNIVVLIVLVAFIMSSLQLMRSNKSI
jgi:hypothetical protein